MAIYSSIAQIDPAYAIRLHALFARNGIKHIFGGSIILVVYVQKNELKRSLKLIQRFDLDNKKLAVVRYIFRDVKL